MWLFPPSTTVAVRDQSEYFESLLVGALNTQNAIYIRASKNTSTDDDDDGKMVTVIATFVVHLYDWDLCELWWFVKITMSCEHRL